MDRSSLSIISFLISWPYKQAENVNSFWSLLLLWSDWMMSFHSQKREAVMFIRTEIAILILIDDWFHFQFSAPRRVQSKKNVQRLVAAKMCGVILEGASNSTNILSTMTPWPQRNLVLSGVTTTARKEKAVTVTVSLHSEFSGFYGEMVLAVAKRARIVANCRQLSKMSPNLRAI